MKACPHGKQPCTLRDCQVALKHNVLQGPTASTKITWSNLTEDKECEIPTPQSKCAHDFRSKHP
eukprot:4444498-Amphidinium_carterae.1